jgi:hypothetical protein
MADERAAAAPVNEQSLRAVVEELRAIPGAWKDRPDPLGDLQRIRHGDAEDLQQLRDMIAQLTARDLALAVLVAQWREEATRTHDVVLQSCAHELDGVLAGEGR